MRKIYWTKCEKYKDFKQHKISYICDKTLLISSIRNSFGNEDQKIFKEEELIKVLKIIGLITLKI